MSKINVSQICEVRVLGLRTNTQYEWREAVNSFWCKQEEGFYDLLTIGSPVLMTVEEIEANDGLVCVDKRVCFKPRIYMRMSDGSVVYKYFKTLEEARTYFETASEFRGITWLDID